MNARHGATANLFWSGNLPVTPAGLLQNTLPPWGSASGSTPGYTTFAALRLLFGAHPQKTDAASTLAGPDHPRLTGTEPFSRCVQL